MNEKVSGCKYSLMIANAFLNFKVFEISFSFPCAAVFASSLSFAVVFAYEEFQEVLLKIR